MKTYLTKDDYQSLKSLAAGKKEKLEELHLKLGEAAKKSGSFVASNPEYMAVKSEIDTIESLMGALRETISKSSVVELSDIPEDKISNYSLVTAVDDEGNEFKYYVQLPALNIKIEDAVTASPASPIGMSLMGKSLGDKVEVNLPNKKLILEIKYIDIV